METYGVVGTVLPRNGIFYENSNDRAMVDENVSSGFSVNRSLRQGCGKSPWLLKESTFFIEVPMNERFTL